MQGDIPYIVDGEFYVLAYDRYKNFDKAYLSILYDGIYYAVYNKLLYDFLTNNTVEVVYPAGKTIDGANYIKSYVEGFKDGEADFDKFFPISVFQGGNADAFINSLHRKCLHQYNEILEGEGWIEGAKKIPYLINHNAIKYYGFFNAKVARYDQLVDHYKELFEKLVRCEYNTSQPEHANKLSSIGVRDPGRIVIDSIVYQRLYDTLKPIIVQDELMALSGLIFESISPSKPISFNGNQNTLAYVFWQLKDAELLVGIYCAPETGPLY